MEDASELHEESILLFHAFGERILDTAIEHGLASADLRAKLSPVFVGWMIYTLCAEHDMLTSSVLQICDDARS